MLHCLASGLLALHSIAYNDISKIHEDYLCEYIQICISVTGFLHETPFFKLFLFQPEESIVYLCAIQYQALDAFITTESQNDNDADKL